jgi:hypothetical protein
MTHERSPKTSKRTISRQGSPSHTLGKEELTYRQIQENLNRIVNEVQWLLEHFKRLRVGGSEAVAAKIEIDSSKMQEQILTATAEALGKRMRLGERSLEVLREMQRIILESNNSAQK